MLDLLSMTRTPCLWIALIVSTAYSCAAGPGPLDVCQILSNIDRYRDQMVVVRGVLAGGVRHGYVLEDSKTGGECPSVQRQGFAWPADIAVEQFSPGSEIEDGPVNFSSDSDEIERQLAAPKRLARRDKDLVIVATVEGLLRSRRGIRIFKSEDGWYAGDGYGQSGQYPAMLVLRTIKDAKAEKSHAKARSR